MKTILIGTVIFFAMNISAYGDESPNSSQENSEVYQQCMKECRFKCQVRSKYVPGTFRRSGQDAVMYKYYRCSKECPSQCALRY